MRLIYNKATLPHLLACEVRNGFALQDRDLFPFDKDVTDEGFDEAVEGTPEVEALDETDGEDVVDTTDVTILFDVEIEKRGDKIRHVC